MDSVSVELAAVDLTQPSDTAITLREIAEEQEKDLELVLVRFWVERAKAPADQELRGQTVSIREYAQI